MAENMDKIKLSPSQFAHVLNQTKNVIAVIEGPRSLVLKVEEVLSGGPFPKIVVPPGYFCLVKNPCSASKNGVPLLHRHGCYDVRFHGEPFSLFPGEELSMATDFAKPNAANNTDYSKAVVRLPVVPAQHAIRLRARDAFLDGDVQRLAGELWQLNGPLTYRPDSTVEIVTLVEPEVIGMNSALRLRATQDCTDSQGQSRVTGEEWLVTDEGAYLPGVYEEVVRVEKGVRLTDNVAVHLEATQNLTFMGNKRKAGEVWLVTKEETEMLIPPIGVSVVSKVKRTVLRLGEFCVVVNVLDPTTGQARLGARELRCGPRSFFLHPGESLAAGIQNAHVLADSQGIVLQATQAFHDKQAGVHREAGERWLLRGPLSYIPPVEVEVITKRSAIPLAKNEGVYVRDMRTGGVRAEMGPQAYLLQENEELWEKELEPIVDMLLKRGGGAGSEDIRKIAYFDQSIDPEILKGRNKTRMVSYRCPSNTACQVFDHARKTARVIFGPDLVILGPHESFNVLYLSAGKPKKAGALQSLALMLGPDFITDIIEVETSDHACLQIKLAFNNHFEFDRNDPASCSRLFAVPDFIGYACSQIGSRIRALVARTTFDEFHKHSAALIRHATFLDHSTGKAAERLVFDANGLVISSIDVQSIEPTDPRMRDSLQKSVQMAIQIATQSLAAAASHEAAAVEQAAKGRLERQRLACAMAAERSNTDLLQLRALTAAVQSAGVAVAEARANAEKKSIEATSHITSCKLKAEAAEVAFEAEMETQAKAREAEIAFRREQIRLELEKSRQFSQLEVSKLQRVVGALGKQTISAIATAGPDKQIEMLQALGLKSVLITDGNSPINLFNTAQGLVTQGNS